MGGGAKEGEFCLMAHINTFIMKVSREDELTTLDERSFHSSTVTRCQGLGSAECQDAQLVGILLGSQV